MPAILPSLSPSSSFTPSPLHLFHWCTSILSFILKKQTYYLDTAHFGYCPLQWGCSQEWSEFSSGKSSSSVLPSDFHPQSPAHCLIKHPQYLRTALFPTTKKPFLTWLPAHSALPVSSSYHSPMSQALLLIAFISLTSKIKCAPRFQTLARIFFLSILGRLIQSILWWLLNFYLYQSLLCIAALHTVLLIGTLILMSNNISNLMCQKPKLCFPP